MNYLVMRRSRGQPVKSGFDDVHFGCFVRTRRTRKLSYGVAGERGRKGTQGHARNGRGLSRTCLRLSNEGSNSG